MPFNVNEFRSVTGKKGFAQSNLFLCKITFPLINLGGILGSLSGREIPFYARSVQIPDFTVNTQDIKVQGYGTSHKRAIGMEHGTLPVVFMIDSDFYIKRLFHAWNQSIYNHGNGGSILAGVDGRKIYELNYKDDYSATIEISVYSYQSESVSYTYRFNGAFPITMSNPQLAWENNAEIMTMGVNFGYDSMYVDGGNDGSLTGIGSGNPLLGFINSLNTIGNAVNNLSIPRTAQDLFNQVNNLGTIIGGIAKI